MIPHQSTLIEPNAAYGQISSGQRCAKVVTSRFPSCLFALCRWFLGRVFGTMATVVNGNERSCGALTAVILGLLCVKLFSLELWFSGIPVYLSWIVFFLALEDLPLVRAWTFLHVCLRTWLTALYCLFLSLVLIRVKSAKCVGVISLLETEDSIVLRFPGCLCTGS